MEVKVYDYTALDALAKEEESAEVSEEEQAKDGTPEPEASTEQDELEEGDMEQLPQDSDEQNLDLEFGTTVRIVPYCGNC